MDIALVSVALAAVSLVADALVVISFVAIAVVAIALVAIALAAIPTVLVPRVSKSCMPVIWQQSGTHLGVPGIAAHVDELAEPLVDEEGADDADYHEDEDDSPLVEYVLEAATVYLVHAQEEPAVRRQTC